MPTTSQPKKAPPRPKAPYRTPVTPSKPEIKSMSAQDLKVLASALVSRAMLFSQLGYEYGGARDLYQALGYKLELKYEDFVAQYERQELAKAVIDRPVSATWRGGFDLLESEDDEDTALETAWAELYDRLKLHSVFARLDRLTGLGRYGVLFLGLSDASNVLAQRNEVQGVKHKLLYVKPYGEGHATILEYETRTDNERYGLPNIYQLTSTDLLSNTQVTLQVHHSRVIHVVDGALESDIEGTPRLESVFNRLKDVEKIVGGSAEMFWRGARPGYGVKIDKDANLTTAVRETMQDAFDEYEHNLRRILELQGAEIQSLAQQVADPEGHINAQIQLISAETGIPKRILTGSEVGELASSQDRENWNGLVQGHREEFAEPQIIRQFVDRMIKYQVLPLPGKDGYSVKWEDLFAMSEKEKVELAGKRTTSIKEYAASPGATAVVPPRSFYRIGLALDDEQIDLITEELEQSLKDEEKLRKELGEEEPLPGGGGEEIEEEGLAEGPDIAPVTQSNPCHNPAGSAGGQFCDTGQGGSSKALTDGEKESLSKYQRTNYPEVNGHLRGNVRISAGDKEMINGHVRNIDKIFQKIDKSEVNVYRGSDAEFTKGLFSKTGVLKELKNAKVESLNTDKPPAGFSTWDKYFNARLSGVTFQDKGFTSTSIKEKVTKEFVSRNYEDPRNGVSSICNIRGTTKAIDMNKTTNDRVFRDQHEMLLQRGNTYRIDSVKMILDKSINKRYLKFDVSII